MADDQQKGHGGKKDKPQQPPQQQAQKPADAPRTPAKSDIPPASTLNHLQSVFPDANQLLEQRPTLEEILKTAVFAFDANSLLEPYRFSQKTFQEFETKLRDLARRKKLFVPAHAMREFAKHRSSYIRDCLEQLKKRQSSLSQAEPIKVPMFDHSVYVAYLTALNKLRDEMNATADRLANWYGDDPISKLYSEIFDKENIIYSTMTTAELKEELDFRNENDIPPGYLDANKRTNAEGDLIIWHTLKRIGKDANIVFVSNDGKPDWAVSIEGKGVFPRFELVEEFRRGTGGNHFVLATLSRFLELVKATPASIAEAELVIVPGNHDQRSTSHMESILEHLHGGKKPLLALWHDHNPGSFDLMKAKALEEIRQALDVWTGEATLIVNGKTPDMLHINRLAVNIQRIYIVAKELIPSQDHATFAQFVECARLMDEEAFGSKTIEMSDAARADSLETVRRLALKMIQLRQSLKVL